MALERILGRVFLGLCALWMIGQGMAITLHGATVPSMTIYGLPEIVAGIVLAVGVAEYLRSR